VVIVVIVVFFYLASKFTGSGGLPGPSFPAAGTVIIGLLYACAVAATLLYYCHVRNRTLGEWLSPGAQPPPFERSTARVETRLAEINAAQQGNLTLYSGEDPFLGTGDTPFKWRKADERVGANERAWSICIELNREGAPGNVLDPEPRGRARIDPVE